MRGPTYLERLPSAGLRRWVRTAWIQSAGDSDQVQRDLPTGGMELHCVLGRTPELVGPLTTARIQVLSPGSTLVGLRFWPGAPIVDGPVEELVDRTAPLDEVWGPAAVRIAEELAGAADAASALRVLGDRIERILRGRRQDLLVGSAAVALMPWRPAEVRTVAEDHGLSSSQLRRRFLTAVGLPPKVLQRTLRFQGYLALAQAAAAAPPRVAELASVAGYADQPHLSRECVRLSGLRPRELLGTDADVCACGHDHLASYRPFLRAVAVPRRARSVQAVLREGA